MDEQALYMICIRYYFEPIHNKTYTEGHPMRLYMICIRYYFEPIHNTAILDTSRTAVVYDMYKILFCQQVKDHLCAAKLRKSLESYSLLDEKLKINR